MSVLFDPERSQHPDTLSEVIGQAVGAASVCWDNMEGTGIFLDGRARAIVDDVVGWINEHYEQKEESVWTPLEEDKS